MTRRRAWSYGRCPAGGRVFAGNQLLSLTAVDARSGKKLWETYDDLPDVASPLAAGELVVAAASYGVVTCLEAATGTVLWRQEFETGFYASPVLAGGRLYLLDRSGVMRILQASRQASLLASPAIGEPADATPAFQDGRIFIRGLRHLFCIGASGG
jgi:outer membrane protein assembly factor BamB